MKTPLKSAVLQGDIDFAGFNALNMGSGGLAVARKFDVKTYGAIGDGTTDDTTAIQSALAAIPSTGGVLYFPAGRYKYTGTTLTLDRQITVEGDGGGMHETDNVFTSVGISTIECTSSTVPLFTVTANGCAFTDIELYNSGGTTPSAGAGIVVTSGGDRTNYHNLTINGFYTCIDVQSGSCQNWHNCFFVAPVLYGLRISFASNPDVGDHAISNCWIYGGRSRAATSAIRIESGGGTKITNSKINAASSSHWVNGIDLAVATGVTTSDLLVSNCSIENYSGFGIKGTSGSPTSIYYNIVIAGNQLASYDGGSAYAINLSPTTAGDFKGVSIVGNVGNSSGSSSPMILLSNCHEVSIIGNAQYGYSALLTVGSGVTFANSATIPAGGTTGQSLKKLSNANYDVGWA